MQGCDIVAADMKLDWSKIAAVLAVALVAALAVVVWLGSQRLIATLAGESVVAPEDAEWLLSERARSLVDAAYADLGDSDVLVRDHWVHALSLGQRSAGKRENRSFVNPDWLSWWYPLQRLRAGVLLSAAGVEDRGQADKQYLGRLLRLTRALPEHHQLHLAALDQHYDSHGRPRPAGTAMAVDNDYVWSIAEAHPDRIKPVVSVHPNRPNAVKVLARWAERGAEAVAWMPILQNIDPGAPDLADYYAALAEHDMTLYTRTGAASGFGRANPAYGNPVRYRAALDAGVNVVMAHVSGDRRYPEPGGDGRVTGTALLLRLLRNPDYENNLHVALAGVTVAGRAEGSLTTWLQHPQVADRLVYASGYPRPAVAAATNVTELAEAGFVTPDQARALREIRAVNPLLFDFVLKRTMRLPHTDLGLPGDVFTREIR